MRSVPSFLAADLERLAAQLAHAPFAPEDRAVLDELLRVGLEAVAARDAAVTAGLVIGATAVAGDVRDVRDAVRRAFAPGARATLAKTPRE